LKTGAQVVGLAESDLIILAVLGIILAIVIFFELRYFRRKRKERVDVKIHKDDAYNSIMTAKAVAEALKTRGRVSREANLLIIEAEAAFQRGNHLYALESINKAKDLLKNAKEEHADPVASIAAKVGGKGVEEKCEVPFQEARKLPKNYLESKFIICSVRDILEQSGAEQRNADAEESLRQADEAFQKEDYTEALKLALRAKRALDGGAEAIGPIENKPVTTDAQVERLPPQPRSLKEPSKNCVRCGASLTEEDVYCRKCGLKVDRSPKCAACGEKLAEDDIFCRKCGNQVKNAYSCPKCEEMVSGDAARCPKCGVPLSPD
jgi:tetratricopeptide (TPR) repeat protein